MSIAHVAHCEDVAFARPLNDEAREARAEVLRVIHLVTRPQGCDDVGEEGRNDVWHALVQDSDEAHPEHPDLV